MIPKKKSKQNYRFRLPPARRFQKKNPNKIAVSGCLQLGCWEVFEKYSVAFVLRGIFYLALILNITAIIIANGITILVMLIIYMKMYVVMAMLAVSLCFKLGGIEGENI
jgi:hypothetical protein